jgi:hypothetical protein
VKRQPWCRRGVGVAWGFTWAVTAGAPAHAEQHRPTGDGRFALEVKACPTVSTESVRRILGIEIGDLLLGQTEGVPAGAARLTIRCAGNLAWIEASGPADNTPFEQILRLDDFPGDAAPRALALAGLELLAARSSTVRARFVGKGNSRPRSRSTPSRCSAVPTSKVAAPEPSPRSAASTRETHIGLAGSWRTFLVEHGPSTWGGQVQASTIVGRMWQLAADAEVTGARNEVGHLGETSALLLSCGATFGVRAGRSRLGAGFGLGGRIGGVRLSGTSADPVRISATTVWRPWGGPMLTASFLGGFERYALTLSVEAGQSLLASEGQADGVTVISIRGPWAAIAVGASIRP